MAVFLSEFGGISLRTTLAMRANGRGLFLPFLLLVIVMSASAAGGYFVAPFMPIPARGLLVGLSLLAAAVPLFVPSHRKPATAKLTHYAMALVGAGGPFVVFALAARSGLPVLAAMGGVLGGVAVILPHLLSETPLNRLLPIGVIRRSAGVVLLLFGAIVSLSALGLL